MVSLTVTRRPFCLFANSLSAPVHSQEVPLNMAMGGPTRWDMREGARWFVPSHQSPWRYLHQLSWGKDPEDRSWAQGRKRHRPHLRWHGGGCNSITSASSGSSITIEIARSNRCCDGVGEGEQVCVHDLHLIGVELGSCATGDCQFSERNWVEPGNSSVYSRILTGW